MKYLDEIKWAWQRVVRGYDERVMWGFSDYFLQVIPALEKFCKQQLHDTDLMKLNSHRHEIYTKTLELIQAWKTCSLDDTWKFPNSESNMLEYIGRNISYFWD